jgi:hypothetical protein
MAQPAQLSCMSSSTGDDITAPKLARATQGKVGSGVPDAWYYAAIGNLASPMRTLSCTTYHRRAAASTEFDAGDFESPSRSSMHIIL